LKAFASWFFKYIITPLIATFVIGFILSSLKIAPLFYLAYPIYVVGGSFIALIVIAAIGLWGWHRERLKKFRKIFSVYKSVSRLKPADFGIFTYNDYYVKRESDTAIEESLNESGLAFITGVPNIGKTRGAYEAVKTFKDWYVMKPPYEKVEINNLKFPFFKKKVILLFDDLEKFLGKFNLDELIDSVKRNSKDLRIIATCRSGKEYEQVEGQKEMLALLSRCTKNKAEPRRLVEKEERLLAKQIGRKWEELNSDGTPGSIVYDLSEMKKRYNRLRDQSKIILYVLKLLREAVIFIWREELVKRIAAGELFQLKIEKYKWNQLLGELEKEGFIGKSGGYLMIAHDSYLDDEFISNFKVSGNTLIELKEELFTLGEAEGLFHLGTCFYTRKNLEEALDCLKRAIKISPDIAEAHNNLGILIKNLKRFEEAEKEYREAIRINPDYADAHNNLGVLLDDLKRPEEAEKEYREAIKIKPNVAEPHYNLGNLLDDLNRPEEAEIEYREAIRINPDYAEAHNNLGILIKNLKRFEEAEKEYREAIRINPDYANAHYNLGNLLDDLNRPEEAEIEYREAIRINPDYAEARTNLGILCQALGKLQEAKIELLGARDIFKKQGREEDVRLADNILKKLENQ
jgi:tetratricopeptide (TPR) repeat protein